MEPVYQQLLAEFPEATPDAIEASLQFLRIAANTHVRMEALYSEYGLTSGRFALLMLLRHAPSNQLSPSEMAKRAQVSRATMTQFIDCLEKDKFITRIDDPNDGRSMLIRLAPKGETVLKRFLPAHLKELEALTVSLNRTERKQLFCLLSKLIRE